MDASPREFGNYRSVYSPEVAHTAILMALAQIEKIEREHGPLEPDSTGLRIGFSSSFLGWEFPSDLTIGWYARVAA